MENRSECIKQVAIECGRNFSIMKYASLLFPLLVVLPFCLAVAFPVPTAEQKAKFDDDYVRSVQYAMSPKVLVSSKAFEALNSEAYRELEKFDLEVLVLIYEKSKENEDSFSKKQISGLEYSARIQILYGLWSSITHCGRFRHRPVWMGVPIREIWEGGDVIAAERTAFLLLEMRAAEKDGRTTDKRRAIETISELGIFALPTLFQELKAGHSDVTNALKRIDWNSRLRVASVVGPKAFDRRTLLDWWEENKKAYELPRQALGFKGSADLWKWKRTGK